MKILMILLAVLLAASSADYAFSTASGGAKTESRENCRQMVFFAVLEGLYRDGVSSADVDVFLRKDKNEKGIEGYIHFVYGCSICMPALDAFRSYRES